MYTFLINALTALILLSLSMAVIGTYITTRRQVFVAGGITHTCFGGLGLGYWLGFSPSVGALIFALAGAFGAERLSRSTRADSAIAVMWALGMALGILFVFLAQGNAPELNSFLFGNVLTVTRADLTLSAIFTAVVLIFFFLFRRLIVAVSLDYPFAQTRSMPVTAVRSIMTILTAIAIVLAIRLTGIMLLMSLVSLPQITAEHFTRNYTVLILLSAAISLTGCIGGLAAAWFIDVPASACIVLLLTLFYLLALLLKKSKTA